VPASRSHARTRARTPARSAEDAPRAGSRSEAELDLRAPATGISLRELAARALPEWSARARAECIAAGRVRAIAGDGERELRAPDERIQAMARVRIGLAADERDALASSQRSALAFESGRACAPPPLFALTATPTFASGTFEVGSPPARARLAYGVARESGGLAWLRLDLAGAGPGESKAQPSVRDVLDGLASLGLPVVGDRFAGGVLAGDGAQLRREDAELDFALAREAEALGSPPRDGVRATPLRISHAAARALERGHPWVLADPLCDDALAYRPGALVELRDRERGDQRVALALADGDGACVARRLPSDGARALASVAERVDAAIERRGRLATDDPQTSALRWVHGEADGLPGIAIDRLGPLLRVLVVGRAGLGIARAAFARAAARFEQLAGAPCVGVEVVNLREPALARGAAFVRARIVRGDASALALDAEGRFEVCERGLAFGVEPGLADPHRAGPGVGLFLDQRANRERMARFARASGGGRWLNLFAHTGAFSVALLAAGASEVVSVDLSARYLRWLDDNLARNAARGVDAGRHVGVRRDGRRFLSELGARERFRGIVLDPPTAASAGRRHWSIRKDLEPLVADALAHLEPGGQLLVCRNDRTQRGPSLADACEAAARASGVRLAKIEAAGPGPDFPSLRGFPEGDPFRGARVERAG